MADSNATDTLPEGCVPVPEEEEFEEHQRRLGIALFGLCCAQFVVMAIWWRTRRHSVYLRKRSLWMSLISGLGMIAQATLVGFVNFQGKNSLPCDLHVWLVFLYIPLSCSPLVVRLITFYNTALYNSRLLTELTQGRLQGRYRAQSWCGSVKTAITATLCWWRRSARRDSVSDSAHGDYSATFALHAKTTVAYQALAVAAYVLLGVGSGLKTVLEPNSPYFQGCSSCAFNEEMGQLTSIVLLLVIIPCAYGLCKVRKTPDPLRIAREIRIAVLICFLSFFANGLVIADPGDLREDGKFDYLYINILISMLLFAVQTTYPILLTYQKDAVSQDAVSFEDMLNDESAKGPFRRYLASEFSAENLYFYEEVSAFEKEYSRLSDTDLQALVSDIIESYIIESSMLQINIGSQVRDKIITTVLDHRRSKSRIPVTLFAQAKAVCIDQMRSDSYPRYLRATRPTRDRKPKLIKSSEFSSTSVETRKL